MSGTFYVETTGNDNNHGSSPTTDALATWAGVLRLARAKKITQQITVQFGLGSFAGVNLENFFFDAASPNEPAALLIKGTRRNVTPTTGSATGTFTSSTTGSAGPPKVKTFLTLTGAGWTTNDFVGKMLVMASGTVLPIVANDATTITVASTAAVAAGAFSIQEPGTLIDSVVAQAPPIGSVTQNNALVFVANNQALNRNLALMRFQDMKFSAASGLTTAGIYFQGGTARLDFTNCEIAITQNSITALLAVNPGSMSLTGCVLNSGAATGVTLLGLGNGTTQSIPNVGVSNCLFRGTGSNVVGFSCNQPVATNWGQTTFQIPNGFGIDVDSGRHGMSTLDMATGNQCIRARLQNGRQGPLSIVLGNSDLNAGASTGVELEGPFFAQLTGVSGTCATGVAARQGARIKVAADCTLNGTSGDFTLDDGVAKDFDSDMRAANPKIITNTYGSIVYQ